jgi:hypothetical protein
MANRAPAKAALKPAAKPAATKPVAKKPVAKGDEPELLDGIYVRSLPPTFRRAGFTFTREGCGLLLANLSQEQLDAIEAEPLLSVTQAQFPATAEADAKLAELAKAQATTTVDKVEADVVTSVVPVAGGAKDDANTSDGTGSGSDNTEGNA